MKQIPTLLVDDHVILRDGLRFALEQTRDIRVVGEAGTAGEAVLAWAKHRPEITLLDIYLPDKSGLDALAEIIAGHPGARFIVLTTAEGDQEIQRALSLGAAGYLLKTSSALEIVEAIRCVHAGGKVWPDNVTRRLAESHGYDPLSARERDVIELIAKGLSNKEVSTVLGISEFTCKIHVRHLLAKLKVSDRTEAVIVAHQRGFVRLDCT